jgi:hypothetical protein
MQAVLLLGCASAPVRCARYSTVLLLLVLVVRDAPYRRAMMMRNALKMQGVQRLAMLVALVVLIVLANIVMMQHVLSRAVSHLQSNMLKAMEARLADINSERAAAAADVRRIMTGKEIVTSRSLYLGDHTVNCYNDDVGMWFLLDSRDVGITPHLCHGSGWEPMITQVFRDTVQTGWHVIDAGEFGARMTFGTFRFLLEVMANTQMKM